MLLIGSLAFKYWSQYSYNEECVCMCPTENSSFISLLWSVAFTFLPISKEELLFCFFNKKQLYKTQKTGKF